MSLIYGKWNLCSDYTLVGRPTNGSRITLTGLGFDDRRCSHSNIISSGNLGQVSVTHRPDRLAIRSSWSSIPSISPLERGHSAW